MMPSGKVLEISRVEQNGKTRITGGLKKKKKKVGVGRKPRVKDTRLVAKEVGDEDKS